MTRRSKRGVLHRKLQSVRVSGAAPVRLHGKGSSSSELRVQQSAFQRKPARVYSTPTLRENAGICTPLKDTLSKWHLIIAVVGQKGQEGNTPRRQTIGRGCSKAIVAWVIFFFCCFSIASQFLLNTWNFNVNMNDAQSPAQTQIHICLVPR